jgi:hypothetical protein
MGIMPEMGAATARQSTAWPIFTMVGITVDGASPFGYSVPSMNLLSAKPNHSPNN